MTLLAIDTATEACSVALLHQGVLYERHQFAPRQHAQLLLPFIDAVLEEAGIRKQQIAAIAVGRGPGGFTGVRLAISAAQGMALGLNVPVVPVSTLAALAMDVAASAGQASILACIDARMGEIYAGVYRVGSDGLVHLQGAEWVGPSDQLQLPAAQVWHVVGSGWTSDRANLVERMGEPAIADGNRFPRAAMIARLAEPRWRAGDVVLAQDALPVYLRDKVALTTAERASAKV